MKTPHVIVAILGIYLSGASFCFSTEEPVENQEKTKEEQALKDAETIHVQVIMFEAANDRIPTEQEGIAALVSRPDDDLPKWRQLLKGIPKDPWGREYIYKVDEDASRGFVILSQGPDPNTAADDIRY